MHRFFPLFFVLVLLLPAQSAAAQSLTCQTGNGPKPIDAVVRELVAAGYGGPWDSNAVATAYANASGSSVTCPLVSIQVVNTPPVQRSGVVLVTGVNTASSSSTFANLVGSLHGKGYSDSDIWQFSYAGFSSSSAGGATTLTPAPFGWMDTCQGLSLSEQRLHDYIQSIRGGSSYQVSLVGHSLGGLIALETAIRYPDIQPALRSVTTIDSPLGGVSALKESLWLGNYNLAYCVSMDELVTRKQNSAQTSTLLRNGAQRLLDQGIWVNTIVNDSDMLYAGATGDQGINGVTVNVEKSWDDGSFLEHGAALNVLDGLQTIVGTIRS